MQDRESLQAAALPDDFDFFDMHSEGGYYVAHKHDECYYKQLMSAASVSRGQ